MKVISNRWMALLLLLSPLPIYLEWGGNNANFLAQVELRVIRNAFSDPIAIMHPLIIAPLCAQIICLLVFFGLRPQKLLLNIALILMGILVLVTLLAGLISGNVKTLFSLFPYQLVALAIVFLPKKEYTN